MIAIAALAVAVTVGGAEFDAAAARAKQWDDDPAANAFVATQLMPRINGHTTIKTCLDRYPGASRPPFTLVVSWNGGVPDRVYLDADTPFARCVAQVFAEADLPSQPPYPDFAETFHMHFN